MAMQSRQAGRILLLACASVLLLCSLHSNPRSSAFSIDPSRRQIGKRRQCAAKSCEQQLPKKDVPTAQKVTAEEADLQSSSNTLFPWASAAAFAAALLLGAGAANADLRADVPKCLLQNCQGVLAKCLLSPNCAADLTCILGCTSSPDEGGCQVKCGDIFENDVVQEFNACALAPGNKRCVPQRPDNGEYPEPAAESISKDFDVTSFNGPWYISAGLNPLFDTFPCQLHFFIGEPPNILDGSPGRLYAKINWRVLEPDGEFFDRSTVQRFVQDSATAGILRNNGNEYLHYEDDWYILDHADENDKEKGFILVYYRGRNDAWIGYGGAVLYTRSATVPEEIVPRVDEACRLAGIKKLDWSKFLRTDNSCQQLNEDVTELRKKFIVKQVTQAKLSVEESLTVARRYYSEAILEEERRAEENIKEQTSGFFNALQKGFQAGSEEIQREEDKIFRTARSVEKRLERMARDFGDEAVRDATILEQFLESLFAKIPKPI